MNAVLDRAVALSGAGVVLRDPLPKAELATELAGFRALLYRGDPGETYCLAVGEAQAVGVPSIVQNIGCVAERVVEGVTGYVAADDAAFAERAIAMLRDNALWQAQHDAALAQQRNWSWDDAAAAFERFLPA
jgi:glycosyltransferase involved in cell wall biosynthesis